MLCLVFFFFFCILMIQDQGLKKGLSSSWHSRKGLSKPKESHAIENCHMHIELRTLLTIESTLRSVW